MATAGLAMVPIAVSRGRQRKVTPAEATFDSRAVQARSVQQSFRTLRAAWVQASDWLRSVTKGPTMIVNSRQQRPLGKTTDTTTMRGFAAVAATGLVAIAIGLAAGTQAAPSGPANAQDTVNSLMAQGYHVIVNKVGSAPLSESTVFAVRPGQTLSRTDSGAPGAETELVTTVTNRTVYVDVK